MRRIVLRPAEKDALRGALPAWRQHPIRRGVLEAFAADMGVHARDAYVSLLHLDTLDALGPDAPVVWKGGTAVQSLLSPGVQRISTDLDFNSTTGIPEALREAVADCNDRLDRRDATVTVQGVPFGRFYEARHRPDHGTLEFRRVLPTPFDEQVELAAGSLPGVDGALRVQGRLSRVQINYRHHRLPALQSRTTEVAFFTQPRFLPDHAVQATRASSSDLVADKILATTRHDGFGRERFKDIYDLIALRHLGGIDLDSVQEKLARIAGEDRVATYVDGTLETLARLGVESAAAQGFRNMVCNDGKTWIDAWEDEVAATAAWLAVMATPHGP